MTTPAVADPADPLDRIAAQLGSRAESVRARAVRVRTACAHTWWRGPAAEAFRCVAEATVQELMVAADRLDDAATALRHHAATVRHVRAVLAAGEHGLASLAGGVAHTLGHDLATATRALTP